MSVAALDSVLSSSEGELLLLSVEVPARDLEDLLDSLAELSFPINPEIYHGQPGTRVQFPAFSARLSEVARALGRCGIPAERLRIRAVLSDML
ncbi:MAG: hypothetical protein K2X35_05935 [Bryobacteraceae bacterium]|nr:hypothetical protein [Bryobacteraceae bacterium]